MPHSTFNERKYDKEISKSLAEIQKLKRKSLKNFVKRFNFAHAQVHRIMMKVNPSPTGTYNDCQKRNVLGTYYIKGKIRERILKEP